MRPENIFKSVKEMSEKRKFDAKKFDVDIKKVIEINKNRTIPEICPLCQKPTSLQKRCPECGLYLGGKWEKERENAQSQECNSFNRAINYATGRGVSKSKAAAETWREAYVLGHGGENPSWNILKRKVHLRKSIKAVLASMEE